MLGQWTWSEYAFSFSDYAYLQTFHFDVPSESAIVQITLSRVADSDGDNVGSAYFTDYSTADGAFHDVSGSYPATINLVANQLVGFSGALLVINCGIGAIINSFVWPSVTSS